MKKKLGILLPILLGLMMTLSANVSAQSDAIVVPDLTGLSIPVAAALLNRTGLNLGGEKTEIWTDSSSIAKDKISGQSVAPGEQSPRGTAVDVIVLRAANVELLYDYNSLTLVNKTGQALDLSDVTLNAFAARSWPQKVLDNGQCAQIWAIAHNGPQSSTECPSVRTWFFNTNKALHFWRGTSGNPQFSFVKKEVQYGVCSTVNPDSPAMRCELFVAGDTQSEATGLVGQDDAHFTQADRRHQFLETRPLTITPRIAQVLVDDMDLLTRPAQVQCTLDERILVALAFLVHSDRLGGGLSHVHIGLALAMAQRNFLRTGAAH